LGANNEHSYHHQCLRWRSIKNRHPDERIDSDNDPGTIGMNLVANYGVNATQLCAAGVDRQSGYVR